MLFSKPPGCSEVLRNCVQAQQRVLVLCSYVESSSCWCALWFWQRHSTYSSMKPASKGTSQRLDLPDLPLSGKWLKTQLLLACFSGVHFLLHELELGKLIGGVYFCRFHPLGVHIVPFRAKCAGRARRRISCLLPSSVCVDARDMPTCLDLYCF